MHALIPRFTRRLTTRGLTVLILAALAGGGGLSCGKKEATPAQATNPVSADGRPRATPREYVVNGQIDLHAMTETLREYVRIRGQIPPNLNELVTSGFATNLPAPPPGKKFVIARFGIGYMVELVDR